MKPVQYFTDEYLQQCCQASPEAVLEYLESFRLMKSTNVKSKLISLKVPEPLLNNFRYKCAIEGTRYQTQIKKIMAEWLDK